MTVLVCAFDEVQDYLDQMPVHIVSIRDPGVKRPTVLEGRSDVTDLVFHDRVLPEDGMQLPTAAHVAQIIKLGREHSSDGTILVHCTMGISRSAAAAAIILAANSPERAPDDVLAQILSVRPIAWPSSLMISLADDLLGRNGELRLALDTFHSNQIDNAPETAEIIARSGRAAEVAAARARRE